MNAQEWSKITKNWENIINLYPEDIVSLLFQQGILTRNDKEKLQSGTTAQRMEELMNTLKNKCLSDHPYRAFIEALRSDEANCWLADKIHKTETEADPCLFSKEDPQIIEPQVRTALQKHFTSSSGSKIKLSDIRKVLQQEDVFKGKNEWPDERLKKFIAKEFIQAEEKKENERVGKKTKKVVYFTNISKLKVKLKSEPSISSAPSKGSPEKFINIQHKEVQNMNPVELKHHLANIFQNEDISTEDLDVLEKENISGKVFLSMKDEDIKEVLPSASFGIRRLLKLIIGSGSSPAENKSLPEHLRKFDQEVTQHVKYFKGRCVDVQSDVRAKRTIAVKNFHLVLDKEKEKALEFIGSEVVPFASACLNERRNGTIYFGISPEANDNYKAGEIVGVDLPKNEVQSEIDDFINRCFSETRKEIVNSTVRNAKFVPVVAATGYVIEIDINASSVALQQDTIRTKLKPLPVFFKKHKTKSGVFKFSDSGCPDILSPDELDNYEKDKSRIIDQRKQEEMEINKDFKPDLRKQLLNLLAGGEELINDAIYTFLMTSPLDSLMDKDTLFTNCLFIKQLSPEIVYDFDPEGSTSGIYQYIDRSLEEEMRLLTIDNFDTEDKSPDDIKLFKEGLVNENKIAWLFCNGYEENQVLKMNPTEWNRKRRVPFQESLKFYIDNFGKERIIFIICLFSKNYDTMIEACDEVLLKLPDNWLLLAETEDIAKLWQDQILARNRVEKNDLKDRCVIGMLWKQVNTTISHAIQKPEVQICWLPSSNGTLVEVREKKLKDWCDINVLTAGDFKCPDDKSRKKEVEANFYRGDQADWLNFYFHGQVLKRDIHDELMKNIRIALKGKRKDYDEDKVTVVPILHQPGAGGTTSAKQVLWDLRKEYRCCTVLTITDQTCDQLDEVWRYQDDVSKPVLILVDNEDEDKFVKLRANLEEKGRKRWRDTDNPYEIYCTIIWCLRRASLPKQLKSGQIALRQELTKKELDWFKEKNESLTTRFEKNKEININPKFLISFNILRENFSKIYVSKVVKEFSADVQDKKEVQLLKIVSLFNAYDPDFKPIQVSCLDKIIGDRLSFRQVQTTGQLARNIKWEATLSQGVKVLLNLTSERNGGKTRKSVRVFSKVIAVEILQRMKERTEQKESDIMFELIHSDVLQFNSSDSKHLQTLIHNVMRKREYKANGVIKEKFSPFVKHIQKNEGAEKAVKLLESLFELDNDAFTAQYIARFYIELKNWGKAECFASIATNKHPNNSFLWDTLGQVFKNQLYDKIKTEKTLDKPDGFKEEEIHELIEYTEKSIDCFRKEQQLSEHEISTGEENNFAGYFGELRAIVLLLSAFKMCPALHKTFHKYLVVQDYLPNELSFLTDHEKDYLKSLDRFSKEAMRRLDEEYLQMKGNVNLAVPSLSFDYDKKSLIDLKINLDASFGEANDRLPGNLNQQEQNDFRSRRARNLGATSLTSLLHMRQNGDHAKILQIYNLIAENIRLQAYTFDNLKTILDVITVLFVGKTELCGLDYDRILDWCRKLYSIEKPKPTDRPYLETYLYFFLYNFPTEERQQHSLCLIADLQSSLLKWHEAFKNKYPKYGREELQLKKRETTLFFLGNGLPMLDIVHHDDLGVMKDYSLQEKWQLPEVRSQLRLQTGILQNGGEKVTMHIKSKEENIFPLTILTSHRVTKKQMWQKKVYFYIGFSFSGPRAFGMSLEEPGLVQLPVPHLKPQIFINSSRTKQQAPATLLDLMTEFKSINDELSLQSHAMMPTKRTELEKKRNELDSAIQKLIGNNF